jgi:protein SCO1/2
MVIIILGVLAWNFLGQKEMSNAKNWPVEDFTATDQEGQPFGLKNLKGKVWVADFIFTNCVDVCPPMTNNMAKLQKMIKDEGLEDVELVSFSVDPSLDSPEALKSFGEKYNIDYRNFHFLTGYSQEYIESFAMNNFKALVMKPENEDQVTHDTKFFLVSEDGKIMQYYSGLNDIPFEQIMKDIKLIQ